MALKDIVGNDLHMKNLHQKIKILQNNCNLKGWLSGPYPKMLCDILLEDIDIYYSEIHRNTFNNMKLQDALQFKDVDIEIYTNSIASSLNSLLDIDLKILDNELNITSKVKEKIYNNTMKSFKEDFNKKAKIYALTLKQNATNISKNKNKNKKINQ